MRRLAIGLLFSALLTGSAFAQQPPKLDIFGGYSFGSVGNPSFASAPSTNLNGFTAAVTANLKSWLGVVGDFSRYSGSPRLQVGLPLACPVDNPGCGLQNTAVATHVQSFLFGPQVSFRRFSRVTPFAHGLFGAGTFGDHVAMLQASTQGFAMALGGGADYTLAPRFSWRFQADYRRIGFSERRQNNFRVSTGLVFHLGRK